MREIKNSAISLMGDPNMLLPIEILGLSNRALNALKNPKTTVRGDNGWRYECIETIGQLLTKDLMGLNKVINLGAKSIQEIADALAERGYRIGEACGQVAGIEYNQKDNLRQIYNIAEDVPTPSAWVVIPERIKSEVVTGLEGQMLTKKFSQNIFVHLPYEVALDREKRQAIRNVFQQAFEIAVGHALDVARDPAKKPNLTRELKRKIPSFGLTEYESGTIMDVDLTASEKLTELIKPGALSKIAYFMDYQQKCGLVMSVLNPR